MKLRLLLLTLSALVGVGAGLSAALFLFGLDLVTRTRLTQPWLVWLLPIAGLGLGWLLQRHAPKTPGITHLFHVAKTGEGPQVPPRLGPLVLVGTLVTHLFGGSAGREGTAVQLGGAWADVIASRAPSTLRRHLVVAGIAGGFGAVFGTPWAGALFGLEVVAPPRWQWRSVVPACIASFLGDFVCRATGVTHTLFPQVEVSGDWWRWAVLAVALAAATGAFVAALHGFKRLATKRSLPLRLAIGGVLVVALWRVVGVDDFLGLGVPGIERAFITAPPTSTFAWKLLFTAVTLGFGFLGGEVTPLFFIGATLGAALSTTLGLPLAASAGVGLATVFAAASKSPVALAVMAAELMGLHLFPVALAVCVVATLLTGRFGIYERSVTNL